jgi:hypothetical protein
LGGFLQPSIEGLEFAELLGQRHFWPPGKTVPSSNDLVVELERGGNDVMSEHFSCSEKFKQKDSIALDVFWTQCLYLYLMVGIARIGIVTYRE